MIRISQLSKKPSRKLIADVVSRIVDVASPDSILLFGSAARGEMTNESDLDLLVVKGGKYNQDRVTAAIYRNLYGIGIGVDVVLVSPEDIEQYRDSNCLVIGRAVREGRRIYGK